MDSTALSLAHHGVGFGCVVRMEGRAGGHLPVVGRLVLTHGSY